MKLSRLLLITLLVSAYATITVVHINMAQPKPVAEATLDMIEIMTRAFDESEGGEGGSNWVYCTDEYTVKAGAILFPVTYCVGCVEVQASSWVWGVKRCRKSPVL